MNKWKSVLMVGALACILGFGLGGQVAHAEDSKEITSTEIKHSTGMVQPLSSPPWPAGGND